MTMAIDDARKLLVEAGVFFGPDEDEPGKWDQVLNLNDAFYWGCSDLEKVEDAELPRVADLFWRYGWCGIAYWVCVEKRGDIGVEFLDQQRFIDFVRHEEELRKSEPRSSKRAYTRITYTLGGPK